MWLLVLRQGWLDGVPESKEVLLGQSKSNVQYIRLDQESQNRAPDPPCRKNSLLEEKEDLVRISNFKAIWIITPIDTQQLLIDYQVVSEPGGLIPDWLVNLAIAKRPYETMISLKRLMEK